MSMEIWNTERNAFEGVTMVWYYRNKRNPNKVIVLKRYECNHYYWAQYIECPNGTKNWVGNTLKNHSRFSRVSRKTWEPVLNDDYYMEKAVAI